MSDSVWPHRGQPTRLPRPWDSPGKNTGVGCHFLLQCMKVKSESEDAQSYPTLSYLLHWSYFHISLHSEMLRVRISTYLLEEGLNLIHNYEDGWKHGLSLDCLHFWHSQGGQTSYIWAGFLQSKCSKRQEVEHARLSKSKFRLVLYFTQSLLIKVVNFSNWFKGKAISSQRHKWKII